MKNSNDFVFYIVSNFLGNYDIGQCDIFVAFQDQFITKHTSLLVRIFLGWNGLINIVVSISAISISANDFWNGLFALIGGLLYDISGTYTEVINYDISEI